MAPSVFRGCAVGGFGGQFGHRLLLHDHDESREMSSLPFSACISRNLSSLGSGLCDFAGGSSASLENHGARGMMGRFVSIKAIRVFFPLLQDVRVKIRKTIFIDHKKKPLLVIVNSTVRQQGAELLHHRTLDRWDPPDAQQPQLPAGTNVRHGRCSHRRTGHQIETR